MRARNARKPLNTTQVLEFGNPKIHVFIDKRRKQVVPEDLSLPCRDTLEDYCENDGYLSYETDDDHCVHNENTRECTIVQSDTETDVSSSSMHMNNVWSEEEQSSFTNIEDQTATSTVQIAAITPVEHVADNTSSICPVHGLQKGV